VNITKAITKDVIKKQGSAVTQRCEVG